MKLSVILGNGALLTAFDLDGAVLLVERVVVEVHHAGERRREAHAVRDGAVAVQPHHLVLLGHVVQEAEESFKLSGYHVVIRQIVVFIVLYPSLPIAIIAIIVISRNCTILFC